MRSRALAFWLLLCLLAIQISERLRFGVSDLSKLVRIFGFLGNIMSGSRGRGSGSSREPLLERLSKPKMTPPSSSSSSRKLKKHDTENLPPEDENLKQNSSETLLSPSPSKNLQARPVKSPRNLPPRPPSAKRKLGLDTINEGSGSSQDTGAKVIIRIRPMRAEMETTQIVNLISSNTIAVVDQQFTFDTVAGVESTQKDIFELVGAPLVENCLAGFNSSIFAYGQTGSGKTYTMWGPMFEKTSELFPNKDRGLTPRVFEQLFSRVQEEEANNIDKQLRYQCRCSFLEIYNEHIIDLLEPNQGNLQIREDVKSGVYVENLTEEYVSNVDDVTLLALKGLANRKVGATSMNVESSRSHSVFTCVLESRYKCASTGLSSLKTSRINLVDLAGSERQKTTGAAGERLKESGNINRSLSHLGNLIKILAEVSRTGKQRHIPYRDSRLTFLLQESLGGNAKLAMICAISPAASCRSETLSTLRFAQRAKAIQNKAVVNEETEDDVNFLRDQIRQLKDELMRMKSQDDQPAGSGVYSTGWNARRSYNILKRSLQHHPLTLPKYDSSSDEEMEIDETAVETVSTATVTQVASFDGMPPKDATVMVNEEKKSNDCQTESDKENVKAPLERKGKVFDDKATQSSFDIESSQNAMVISSVEMEDIQGALATNTSVISEVKVEENSLILSGSIPFKGTCPTTESQVSGVSNVTDMLEGMIVKKEEDLVPSRSISLEDLCGITEPQVTESVSETQVKVDVFETNISEEKIVNNEENDLVLSDNTSLKDVLRVTEPQVTEGASKTQVTEGASKTQVTEDVSERNISEEKIVNKEENDLVPSDNISLKDVHGVTKPQVTKDALKTQVTKDVSETNISEENIVNKKENDLVPNDNISLKDLREVNEPQVTEDASEIQVTENASETNISEENIVNKEENDLVPNDSNSFIDLSEVPKPQVTEHPFEEQPTETSISISIGEELSECEKHEALVTEKVAEELPTVQVDEKSSSDEFEFCIPQDLSSTDAENKENLVGEIKPQIVSETHDNGELDACNSTSFSIVPEQDSSIPVLASPPMSVSPTLKSGRRDNQRLPPSFGDSSSEWGSEGPNLSFAQSVAIKKSTEGAVSSVDRLAASLQHGLKVIDQHAAIRKSSVRFSMQAFNMQAPQFQLLTEKVDKSVQTEMLDSTGSLSAKDGQDNSHLQLVAVEADKLSPDKQIYLSTAVEGVLAGSIRRELATEEVCSRQAAEIEHLNRLVNQYKHERDCNSILQQARDEKIARLENLLNGVLSKDDFLKDELDALSFEHKVLKEKYENHPEVTLAKIEEARLNDELEKYRNFFNLGERDVLQEEIKDLRNQLQQYLDRGGVHVSTKKLRQSLLMRSTQKLEAKDDSNAFALNTVPELPSLDMENIMSDKQWEEENRLWRERENEWISLVDDLRKEVASATRLAEKRKTELESEQKCSEEMKEALKISLAGHTRFLEQFAELQENYMSLLAKHKAIREGTAEARTVAIKAGCKGAQLKIIEDLGGQVIALKQERDQIRRCAKKEIDGLQAQLRDTVDAVQAAGELVVRLKEAEEAVALAQDFASHSEQNAENLRREIEKLKRMHATELAAFNQRLRESRLGMSSICTMCQFAERAKYDFESSEDCPVAEEEEKENSDKENTGGASNPLCEEGGLDYDDDVLRQDTSWFSGYDKCNI